MTVVDGVADWTDRVVGHGGVGASEEGDTGSLVGRVGGGRFRLAAKELAFAEAELGPQLLDFGLEFGEA